jgi:hypothetical protein
VNGAAEGVSAQPSKRAARIFCKLLLAGLGLATGGLAGVVIGLFTGLIPFILC